jgi:colicin import membrane protein
MPRKLKTFVTSMGFYDLAIAAPSKGALEAWGSNNNLFHQGFARQIDDPEIVAATMAKPGVVLQRPVGTNETFLEHANLPSAFDLDKPAKRPHKAARRARPAANSSRKKKVDDKAARKAGVKAAAAYEKEWAKRERERQRYESAEAKKRERSDHTVKKAQAELEKAQQDHATRAAALDKERQRVEARMQAEESRWKKVEDRLKDAIRRAGG